MSITTIRTDTVVEFTQSTGIIPQGTRGTVVRVSKGTYLVRWNYADPSRKGDLLNWHRARSLKAIDTREDWYEPAYVQ